MSSDSTDEVINYDSDLATGDQQTKRSAPVDGTATPSDMTTTTVITEDTATYKQDDLIGAAEGVFGKGAQGLAWADRRHSQEQGEPNAYIVGREAGGALVLGVRYGSGTLHHKIEGELPAYWTGPSIGFDAGANAGNTFVLVYNLFDSEELYKRFPAGEGAAYLLGGFNASYLRRGDVVLIPIRVGVGCATGRQRRLYEVPQEAELGAVLTTHDDVIAERPVLRRGPFCLRGAKEQSSATDQFQTSDQGAERLLKPSIQRVNDGASVSTDFSS